MGKLLVGLFVLGSISAFAEINCSVDKDGYNRVNLKLGESITFENKHIEANYDAGNSFDGQSLLTMELENSVSKVYDVKDSLYVLESNGIKIQCYKDN